MVTARLAILGTILVAGGPPTQVATLRDLGPALTACFKAPDRSAGSAVTVRFSLDASGAVIGKPMITFSKLVGSADDKQAFVSAALEALSRCTPVHVSKGMGAAIAGRPLSVRFVGGSRSQSI